MRHEIAQIIRQDQVMELVFGNNRTPKKILGRHMLAGGQVISAYHPDAVQMCLIDENGISYPMEAVERSSLYAIFIPRTDSFIYTINMKFRDGNHYISEDPYSFPSQITKEEEELFLQGNWVNSYEKLGAHPMTIDGVEGVYFAVWAPNARRVSVVGDFNFWNGMIYPMNRLEETGIFELFIPRVKAGSLYKFEVKNQNGVNVQKMDPFGTVDLHENGDSSIVLNMKEFSWTDGEWMVDRRLKQWKSAPVSVCDREFLDRFADEFQENECFTHVLLKSPMFCHGVKGKIRDWINDLHKRGIGVILEISMGAFGTDHAELTHFDGTSLYGNSGMRIISKKGKELYCFDHSKKEVLSFLLSNLIFWIREYHVDGFLFAGVSDMLYPVSIKEKDQDGNPKTIYQKATEEFLCDAVKRIKKEDFSVLLFSDEKMEKDHHNDNLMYNKASFDALVNYGIVENLGEYLLTAIDDPGKDYYKLGLPMMKNGIRKTIVNVSITQSVHFTKRFLDNSFLNEYDRLSWRKLTMGYLLGVPGKKRWSWHDLESAPIQNYMKHMFRLYMEHKCMYCREPRRSSFHWINGLDAKNAVLTFTRSYPGEDKSLLFVCNFSRDRKEGFQVGAPEFGEYRLLVNSDWQEFGGSVRNNGDNVIHATKREWDLQPYSLRLTISPLSVLVFEF